MRKFLFLLISFFIMTIYSEAADNSDDENSIKLDTSETFKKDGDKKLEFDSTTTLKKDGDKKLEFDSTETLKRSNTKSTADIIKKIKEIIKKDPKKAELLTAKANDLTKLLKEAEKYKDIETAKACAKAANSLKTLAEFHSGKEISDRKLYQAYNDCKSVEKDIKKFKIRINSAKRNTPQAIKIRSFQFAAKDYLDKAKKATEQGKKAKAEYYNTCAKIKQNAADNYAQDPKIEAISKQQIKEAIAKYNQAYTQEIAVRFRNRAKKYREDDDTEKAEYYEKAASLKEKLAEAYDKDNKSLVKSLKKEYEELQKTKK